MSDEYAESLAMLQSMGFDAELSLHYLKMCNGSVERAANMLLQNPTDAPPGGETLLLAPHQSNAPVIVVQGPMSQYSVENGQSACTCMALYAASNFLKQSESPQEIITADFLQNMITKGVDLHQQVKNVSAVDHLSAEQVLETGIVDLELVGGIRQGILSNDPAHPQGLLASLTDCQAAVGSSSACVVLTKTPETVLVCFAPPSSPSPYILIDSHPRHQIGTEQAYALQCSSLQELVRNLGSIFPVTDLPDIPELMAIMYNSFDLYLVRNKT
jgi:hypothetical protein